MIRFLFVTGAVLGMLAVAAGAFGAHGLRERLTPEALAWWETGAKYQIYHALALLAAAWLGSQVVGRMPGAAGWCFLAGTAIFSGTLYLMALGAPRWLGAITPIGGVLLIVGWLLLALAGLKLGRG